MAHFTSYGAEFSFYSPVHTVYSRLDYWLLSAQLMPCLLACQILPLSLSDHSPVLLHIHDVSGLRCHPPWRLRGTQLLDLLFCAEVRSAIEEFFSINEGSVASAGVLWESFKVYISGICISKVAGYCAPSELDWPCWSVVSRTLSIYMCR